MKKKLVFDERGLEAFIEFLKVVKESNYMTINSMSVKLENIEEQQKMTIESSTIVSRNPNNGYLERTYEFEIDEESIEEKNIETDKE